MTKTFFPLLFLFFSSLALANSSCDDIPGNQNYSPLVVKNGFVCFVEQPVIDPKTNEYLDLEYVVVYFIPYGQDPIKAEGDELFYENNGPGKIVNAFAIDINQDERDEVILIHYIEARHPEPNSSGEFYSVYVFSQEDTGLRLNERASGWFGFSYSWFTNGESKLYEFPYLSQQSVQNALSSPFMPLMEHDEVIPVIVKRKSYLYEESMIYGETNKYLIAGDKVTVDKYTAGWCHINYTGGRKPLQMWIMCDALEPDITVPTDLR